MKYDKPCLSFEKQADLLIARGLVTDRNALIQRLSVTNYFRLSGYLYPFRELDGDRFIAGTSLDQVWNVCRFDQRLRTLLLDAIEAVEVFTRTQLAYHFAQQHDAFDYHKEECLPNLERHQFLRWREKLETQVKRSLHSKEEFIVHFFDQYGDEHTRPPIWTLIELMDFGAMLTFYRGVDGGIRKEIARYAGVPEPVFSSWLLALNTIRNRCAHHLRLWNWTFGTPVKLPHQRKRPQWHQPAISNDRTGVIIFICRQLLDQISPQHQWADRVEQLFSEFPQISTRTMGLPNDWKNHSLWKI